MPRPSMGSSARIHPVTLKLSKDEVDDLSSRHGTPAKGLRALLDADRGPRMPITSVSTGRCRIHPDWEVIKTRSQGGMTLTDKRCTVCGTVVTATKPS